jgi:peptidylprolyl isomerase
VRVRSLLGLVLVPALFVVGCGDSGGGDEGGESAATNGSGELSGITVTGSTDEKPKVEIEDGFSVEETTVEVLAEGDGEEVGEEDVVTVDYLGVNAKNGEEFDSSWSREQTADFTLGPGMIAGFNKALAGQQVGDRVLAAIPPQDGYGEQGNPQAGIGGEDTLVFVVDIRDTAASKASGEAVEPPQGMPTVTTDDSDTPTGFGDMQGPPPESEKSTSYPVIKGEGPEVEKGQTVTMQYLGQVYGGKQPFDQSWGRAPLTLPVGEGKPIPCFDQLVGETVGSRVVLVCPPAEAFGDQGNPQGGIKPDDTVLFAVDILTAG